MIQLIAAWCHHWPIWSHVTRKAVMCLPFSRYYAIFAFALATNGRVSYKTPQLVSLFQCTGHRVQTSCLLCSNTQSIPFLLLSHLAKCLSSAMFFNLSHAVSCSNCLLKVLSSQYFSCTATVWNISAKKSPIPRNRCILFLSVGLSIFHMMYLKKNFQFLWFLISPWSVTVSPK